MAGVLWLSSIWALRGSKRILPFSWIWIPAALAFLALIPTSPRFDHDLERYLWDGKVSLDRGHPYGIAPSDYRLLHLRDERFSQLEFIDTPTVYPPLAEALFAGAAATGENGPWVFKGILFCAFLASLYLFQRLFLIRNLPLNSLIIYAWNPLLLKEVANSGHVDLIGGFFLLLALHMAKPRPRFLSIITASAIKPFPLQLLGFVSESKWKRLISLFFTSLTLAGVFHFLPEPWTKGMRDFSQYWTFYPWGFEWLEALTPWPRQIVALLPIVIPFIAIFRGWSFETSCETLLMALLFFSPVVNPWYLLWLLPIWTLRGRAYGLAATVAVVPSYLFYVQNSDPSSIRHVGLLLVLLSLVFDFLRQRKRVSI